MKLTSACLLGATALTAILAAPAAQAQDAAPASEAVNEADGGEIIVTGNVLYSSQVNALKTPTLILDVPQSLSIVTADQIKDRGFDSIAQIIDYTPGVTNSQGEGHRDSVVFRGVRSTADFFIDGMRDDVQYYRPLYNLEQVEILRGPNALLFGRGGTGGILNRVTKKGELGETFIGGELSVDTFGGAAVQLDANLSSNDTSAFRVNVLAETLNNHRDFYDGERFGINPTARFKLGEDTLIDLSYEYLDHQRFIDRGIPTGSDGRPVAAFQDIVFGDPELNNNELTAHLLRASVQHNFSDNVKGNFSAFYGDYDKLYENFYASGYDQVNTPDVVTLDGYIDTTQRQNLILSGNLIGEFDTGSVHHTLIVGGEFIDTSSNQDRFNSFFSTTSDDNEIFTIARPLNLRGGIGVNAAGISTGNDYTADLNDDTRVNIKVFSAYVQDEIELTDWLHVIVGGRFDSFDIDVNNLVAGDQRSRKDSEFSPRAGLILKPQENISIYASYSESFLPRSGEQFANINGNNDALAPNTFTNLEAGLKWDIDPRLSFTAAVFEIEQSSPQVADNDPATFDVIDSTIQGFELQLQGELIEGWSVSAGYSYLDGEQQDRTGPTGLRPRELPKHTLSLWNAYEIGERFGLGLGMTYQAASFVNNGNTATLPSYVRVDASAYYDISDNVRIQVNVENALDELYFPNSHSTHQVTVGAPVNARFAISGRF